jgi:transcriptional regulator with XRE-family HTH domain
VPKSISALVTPSALRWARELAGMDVAAVASKASTSEERTTAWETGDAKPTLRQTRLLAAASRLPLAAFYLPEPPPAAVRLPKDDGRLAGTLMNGFSVALRLNAKDAREKREIALDLISASAVLYMMVHATNRVRTCVPQWGIEPTGPDHCNPLDLKTLTPQHRALSPTAVQPWGLVELMCPR